MRTREPSNLKATSWQGHEPHHPLGDMEMDGKNRNRMYATARRSVPRAAGLCTTRALQTKVSTSWIILAGYVTAKDLAWPVS